MCNSGVGISDTGFGIDKPHRDNYVLHRRNTSHPKVIYTGGQFKEKGEKRSLRTQILLRHGDNIAVQDLGYCTSYCTLQSPVIPLQERFIFDGVSRSRKIRAHPILR